MSHGIEPGMGGGGILSNKLLWFCIGVVVFILVAFILPTPQSVVGVIEKYGFAKKMNAWGVAHDAIEAAHKTKIVLGIIPMAVIFFATEAIPIGFKFRLSIPQDVTLFLPKHSEDMRYEYQAQFFVRNHNNCITNSHADEACMPCRRQGPGPKYIKGDSSGGRDRSCGCAGVAG